MSTRVRRMVGAIGLLGGVSSALAQGSFTLIGDFAGPVNGVTLIDISGDGRVAVGASTSDPPILWRWTPTGLIENLGGYGGFSVVSGDGTTVYGESLDANFPNPPTYTATHAVSRWLGGQSWQSLGGVVPCDRSLTAPRWTNATGSRVVGLAWIAGCQTRAYRWTEAGGIQTMPNYFALGGSCSANAASEDGNVVVGWNNGNGPGGRTGVYWVGSGNATLVGGSIGTGELMAVTPDGVTVLGRGHPTSREAFLWNRLTGAFTQLGTLPGVGASVHVPLAMTADASLVVGTAGGVPFIWRAGVGMEDLRTYLQARGGVWPDTFDYWTPTSVSADGRFIAGWTGDPMPVPKSWIFDHTPPTACAADLDDGSGTGTRDGGVTIEDLVYFVTKFGEGDVAADLDDDGVDPANPDGGVTIEDLIFFLTHFAGGC